MSNTQTKTSISYFLPLVGLFLLVLLVAFTATPLLNLLHIQLHVLVGANVLLFLVSSTAIWLHVQAIKSKSPYAFSRSIMGSTTLKLIVFASSLIIYFLVSGSNRNVPAVFSAMVLYILYTIIEVSITLKLNRK